MVKIFFLDDNIQFSSTLIQEYIENGCCYIPLYAGCGYKQNLVFFKEAIAGYEKEYDCNNIDLIIFTNQIAFLDTPYSFDNEGNCQVYFWSQNENKWKNAQDCTDKELRRGHNIEMMYKRNAFEI